MGMTRKRKIVQHPRKQSNASAGKKLQQIVAFNQYVENALMSGLSFEELEKKGVKFGSI
jgi:hypothetical protein